MKKILNVNKNKIMNKFNNSLKNSGFTLVELLAVVAILSIVSVIVMYTAFNLIGNAKDKSYQVSISNIEKGAGSYAVENQSQINWLSIQNGESDDLEYLCIRVQDLIDKGYFKSDVLESKISENSNVLASDYIYLERNKKNKSIEKSVLLFGDRLETYSGLCGDITVDANIMFNSSPYNWSKQKNVNITYNIYNISESVSNYSYGYKFKLDETYSTNEFSRHEAEDVFVYPNVGDEDLLDGTSGMIYASIMNDEETIFNSSYMIDKIDVEMPSGSITSTNNVASSQTVTLNIQDNAGVIGYYFGKTNPQDNDVVWTDVDETASKNITTTVDSSGVWYLAVKDVVDNVVIVSKEFYETKLVVSNATVNPTKVITMEGNSFVVPNASASSYYTFNGWYTNSDYSGSPITTYKPTDNKTIYGKTTENKLNDGSVLISGNNTYGETLTATVNDTTPKADSYEYQWYYNTSNSTTGGTKINGATSSTYRIKAITVGKYVYVEVTAKKDNYRDRTLTDITDVKIAKRNITVTAGSKSKAYDGTALTDSACTATNLAFSHSVTCNMTSQSTITNVGSVNNTISSISVWNDSKNGEVNAYYNISYNTGTLTVTKKSVDIPTASVYCNSLTYNGNEQTLTKAAGTGYTFSNNKKTNAETYTVSATLSANYKWSDGETGVKTFDCSISKKTATITAKDQTIIYGNSITTGTANVTTSGLVSAHSVTSITLNASTASVTTSGTITASAATIKNGSTEVTTNYNITYKTGKLIIDKISASIPTASDYCKTELVYTGSIQTLTKAAGTGYTFSNNKKTEAGTYTVSATLSANYKWSDGETGVKTFDCSISKATPTMTATPTSMSLTVPTTGTITYTYNGDGTVSCKSSSTSFATCTINTSNKTVTVTPVGDGTATITVTASSSTNYKSVSKTVIVTSNAKSCYRITASSGVNCRSSRTTEASNVVTAFPNNNYYYLTQSETENGYTWYYNADKNCYVVSNYIEYYGTTCPSSNSGGGGSTGNVPCTNLLDLACCRNSCSGGTPLAFVVIDACYCCSRGTKDPLNLVNGQFCKVIIG